MPQLSLYLTNDTAAVLREDAMRSELSVSRYVSDLIIDKHDNASSWPQGYWDSIYGCLDDPSFVIPEELDAELDGDVPKF